MATHSGALAWRIPGMGEPGGLPSMGLHRVGHDWSDLAAAACFTFCNFYHNKERNLKSRDTVISFIFKGRVFSVWFTPGPTARVTGVIYAVRAQSLQSFLTLCDPMNCSPPGSLVHRILQARILGCIAMPSSRESSWPRDWTQGIFPTQRLGLLHCKQILYCWATREAPIIYTVDLSK